MHSYSNLGCERWMPLWANINDVDSKDHQHIVVFDSISLSSFCLYASVTHPIIQCFIVCIIIQMNNQWRNSLSISILLQTNNTDLYIKSWYTRDKESDCQECWPTPAPTTINFVPYSNVWWLQIQQGNKMSRKSTCVLFHQAPALGHISSICL